MTDFEKIKKIETDLATARARREALDAQIKELERKYKEAENVAIHNLVHNANMSPEQLAALIKMSTGEKLKTMDGKNKNESEDIQNDEEIY